MTAAVLAVYGVALAATVAAVWRRPVVALYAFVLALPLHNLVLSLLYGGGLRGGALDAVQAWKETLLVVALASVGLGAWRARRLPFRIGLVDLLALTFAAFVAVYALVPQSALGGGAGHKAILYAVRHDLVPVAAYFLGRSLVLDMRRLRSLAWTLLGAAAAVAAWGIVDEYAVPIEWWHHSGAVGYFHRELGFDYHGPGGLPENFAFNTSSGLYRRLVSVFVSPLATGYMLVVALLLAAGLAALRRRVRLAGVLAAVCFAGLLFTFSRSSIAALAGGLVVLAIAARRWWPLPVAVVVAAAGFGFASAYPSIAPRTHWFASDLPYQQAVAKQKGPLPKGSGLKQTASLGEPSIRSHLTNLRDGLRTVVHHPQGFGLGNAGATAARFGVKLEAGESNYTEIGVETGLAGIIVFAAWNLALLFGLIRSAWRAPGEGRWALAALAAAFAAILAVAIQTDAYGVPWLGYCLWWLAGSALARRAVGVSQTQPRATGPHNLRGVLLSAGVRQRV